MTSRRAGVLLLVAAAFAPGADLPPRDCPAIDPPATVRVCPAVDPVRPAGAGLRIFLDRRNGRVRPPTPEEARALVESGGRGVEYLEPFEIVVSPDGMRSVNLKGAFQASIEMRREPDGSLRTRCAPAGAEPRPVKTRRALLSALLLAGAASLARPATITLVVADNPGTGFNDPAPAVPIGGNTGTTLGEQRRLAFQHGLDIWGALLQSDVEIRVQARFTPLPCSADSGTLASTGTIQVVSDFAGAEFPGTWYATALANKRAGQDLRPGDPNTDADDIQSRFNSALGNPGCLQGIGWYYGLDDNHGAEVDLVSVVLHEIAHGLGFLTLVNETNGTEFFGSPDIFERHIQDGSTGLHWDEMTDDERRISARNARRLVWGGARVAEAVPTTLAAGTPLLRVDSPASVAGVYSVGPADFGPSLAAGSVSGPLVGARDASDAAGPADDRRLLGDLECRGDRRERRVRGPRNLFLRRQGPQRAGRRSPRRRRGRQRTGCAAGGPRRFG